MKRFLLLAAFALPAVAVTTGAIASSAAAPAVQPKIVPAIAQGAAAPAAGAKPDPALARGAKASAAEKAHPELAGLPARAIATTTIPASDAAPLAVGIWPAEPYQGALLVVDVATPAPILEASGSFLGRELSWHRLDERTWRGMGPVPDDAKPGASVLKLEVKSAAGEDRIVVQRAAELQVRALDYEKDELRVDPKFTKLTQQARTQIAKDRKLMSAMWKKGSSAEPLFRGNFVIPRDDRTTAPYGTRRTYNGLTKSVHQGWDIDGDVGEEIRAPNAGVVTLASDLYYSGGTLFVDHGGGLYTGYFHMHDIAVKPGERVEAGQLLGTVGKSGRVTGPHLHWAAKIGGQYIHPASVLLFDFARPMVAPPGSPAPSAGEGLKVVPAGMSR